MLLLPCLILCSLAIFLVFLYLKFNEYLHLKRALDKLPGPKGYPLVGSIFLIMDSPENVFQNIRAVIKEYGSCFAFWIGTYPTVNISSPEDIEIVISSMKNHRKGFMYNLLQCWLGTGLLTSQDDKWRIRRKILTPSFHFSILQQFFNVVVEHTKRLAEELEAARIKEESDVVPHITRYTLNTICETAMGTRLGDDKANQERYMRKVYQFGEHLLYRVINPWFVLDSIYAVTTKYWKLLKICNELHTFSTNVINEREKQYNNVLDNYKSAENENYDKKRLAMLDVLLSSKYQDGSIDNNGIREEVDTFIFEGHDTTAMSLCFTLMLLACNKDCQENIVKEFNHVISDNMKQPTFNQLQDLKYMERCIKESLRLYPSVPLIVRKSDGTYTSNGHFIPQGCDILIHIYDLHRRPELYPNPEEFNPDRFLAVNVGKRHPFAYIPFSAGPRNCIGQKFAMMEMKAVLLAILRNFILEPIDTPETIQLIPHMVIRPKDSVKVKLVPRI